MATGDLMELKIYEDYKGPKLSPELVSQIKQGDYSGVTKAFESGIRDLITSGLFEGVTASKETGGKSLQTMFEMMLEEIGKQAAIIGNDDALNKNELDVLTLLAQTTKSEVGKSVFEKAINETYADISVSSDSLKDESGWGTFIEESWYGVIGGEHSKSGPDVEGMVNDKLVKVELKLTGGAKSLLAGQITFHGFDVEVYRRAKGEAWEEKVSITTEQLNNPYFRMGVTIYKMITKMYNFLYFYIDMIEQTAQGTSQNITIRTMILYTTLWIEKVIAFVMNSVNVTFERMGNVKSPTKKGDRTIGIQSFVIKVTTKEGDLLASVGKLGDLYKRELFLIINSKYAASLKKVRTAYALIREMREFMSINESLIGS